MVNAWTMEASEHLQESTCCSTSSLTTVKSGIQSLHRRLNCCQGEVPFIMLRSRGISQICHTYSENMYPLPWLHTPRLRLRVTTVYIGAYSPLIQVWYILYIIFWLPRAETYQSQSSLRLLFESGLYTRAASNRAYKVTRFYNHSPKLEEVGHDS